MTTAERREAVDAMNPEEAAERGYAFKKADVVRWYRQAHPVQEAVSRVQEDIRKRVGSTIQRQVETAAGRIGKTAGTALAKNAGTVAVNLAKASVVGLAGFAAYWMTSKLLTLRYKTYAELRWEASNWYRRARAAAAEQAGRPLTGAELQNFKQWYDARIARLNEAERAGRPVSGATNLIFGD